MKSLNLTQPGKYGPRTFFVKIMPAACCNVLGDPACSAAMKGTANLGRK